MDDTMREAMVKVVARAIAHHKGTEETALLLKDQFGLPVHKAEEAYSAVRSGLRRGESCIYKGLSPAQEMEKINSKLGRIAFQHALDVRNRRKRTMKVFVAIAGVLIILIVLALNYTWLAPLLGLVEEK